MIRRRQLLAGAGLGLAGAAFFGPRRARAAWGEWPEAHAELALPPERRAGRVLELYAYGGMCPWDTFYCMPEWGLADQRYLHAFGEAALAARLGACGLAGALAAPFAPDAAGPGLRGTRAQAAAFDRGVLTRTPGDTLVFAPPFVSTEHDLQRMAERLRLAITDTAGPPA